MGWAAGSGLGIDIWNEVRGYVPESKREEVALFIYNYVCDLDADDWDGTSQLEIDAQVESYCWQCDLKSTADKLIDGLCEDCREDEDVRQYQGE